MFVTIEGIEGSGKTTQIPGICAFLEQRGHRCTRTREPGGTAIGAAIRAILLDPASDDLDEMAELLLYAADRAQHVAQVIRPALADGQTVVCDRYFDATLAYQGAARGISSDLIHRLHTLSTGGMRPDLTLLLDLPAEAGLARAWRRIQSPDRPGLKESRFETEAIDFHRRVRQGYLTLAQQEPERYRLIDAAGDADAVARQIHAALSGAIDSPRP
jgi:dTMP kinase